jgi:hemerythrin-like metal-binding protein
MNTKGLWGIMKLDTRYETGVVWQDFQHGQLIELFEKIKEAKSGNKDKNLYRYTLAFLAMYVNHHFKLEEEYMEKYDYPAKDVHRREHKKFISQIKQFRAENMEYSREGSDQLVNQLGEWILNHILKEDQQLGQFIKKVS